MENCRFFVPPIKSEEVKLEIKSEQYETDKLEIIESDIDLKINLNFETCLKRENEVDKNEIFLQTKKVKIKLEETEESCMEELNELNGDKEVFDPENIPALNKTQDVWKCYLCRFCHYNNDELKAHVTSTHRDPSNLNFFKCSICDYRTEYIQRLASHKSWHKSRRKKQQKTSDTYETAKCSLCDFTYQTEIQLGEHLTSHHKDPQNSNKYKCTVCNYITNGLHRLILHKSYHDCLLGTIWYQCYKCNYKSKMKNNLRKHVVKHEGISKTEFSKSLSESNAVVS